MNAKTFIKQETQADTKLRLFSLYVDFAASARAKWASGAITKLVGLRWKTCSEMWNLDSFKASQQIRRIILQGAADADVLIVGLSSLDQRESKLMEWLNALAGQKAEHPGSGLLIGLLGDEDHDAGELGWTVQQFIRCAQKMGMDFIWHWMGQEAINETAWLTDNMEKFLSRKQSQFNIAWLQGTAANVGQLPGSNLACGR
jgi:hypothetical protein